MSTLPAAQSGRAEYRRLTRSANLPRPVKRLGPLLSKVNRVSLISVWRYVCPFVRNNHFSVCNCNRIVGLARDGSLPQYLASTQLGPHSNLANPCLASA